MTTITSMGFCHGSQMYDAVVYGKKKKIRGSSKLFGQEWLACCRGKMWCFCGGKRRQNPAICASFSGPHNPPYLTSLPLSLSCVSLCMQEEGK